MGSVLAERYRRFGENVAGTSPLSERVAVAISRSDAALRAIEAAPARHRHPARVLAALHDLALAGHAPALADAYAARDADAAATAAIDVLLRQAVDLTRAPRPEVTGRATVLHPLVAEAAHRVGADAIGLVDVGCAAGLDLALDRVAVTYDDGPTRGAAMSTVRYTASVVKSRPVPPREVPDVVARLGIDLDPIDVADPDQARWLRACLPPDHADKDHREAEIAMARETDATLLRGDAVDLLPDALARVPGHALPVVTTTWTLSAFPLEHRLRFLQRLDAAATDRPVAWVSAEGVGVAPAVPTMGDRPASGHSILGLVILEHGTLRADAVGRCWSRGRMLSWF
ncbi:DUF2332 domain-containing protein [Actinomycetospora flava]|uniref:DUF2332 domain-containing protein n=1 Tax=Actinomycetospora flava TaxID=3129232 RepID=A0ABU8MB25_9PSEU